MTDAVTAAELRQIVEQIEQLDAEKADIAAQRSGAMQEAKSRGYDTTVIRALVAMRRRKPDEVAEFEAVFDLYRSALGMV